VRCDGRGASTPEGKLELLNGLNHRANRESEEKTKICEVASRHFALGIALKSRKSESIQQRRLSKAKRETIERLDFGRGSAREPHFSATAIFFSPAAAVTFSMAEKKDKNDDERVDR